MSTFFAFGYRGVSLFAGVFDAKRSNRGLNFYVLIHALIYYSLSGLVFMNFIQAMS